MKLDWKKISASEGYLSLKKAFAALHAEQNKRNQKYNGSYICHEKSEIKKLFKKIIDRAQHIHARTGLSVESVLAKWEKHRRQARRPLFSYYVSSTNKAFNKAPVNPKKPIGIRGFRKDARRWYTNKHDRLARYKQIRQIIRDREKSDKLKAQ